MSTYTAMITREGKWWMVAIPAIDGLTQARRLSEAQLMAREYIAVTLDVPLADVSVVLEVESIGQVAGIRGRLAAIEQERTQAIELEKKATAEASALARELVAADVPLRDVGAVLGVSFQRAHQLAHQ